jgi:hypothetical protein
MELNKYFVEFMGVVVILYSKFMTNADPTAMAIVYFSMFSIAKNITTGYFTPLAATTSYLVGRAERSDFIYNIIAHVLGMLAVSLTVSPIKVYMTAIDA